MGNKKPLVHCDEFYFTFLLQQLEYLSDQYLQIASPDSNNEEMVKYFEYFLLLEEEIRSFNPNQVILTKMDLILARFLEIVW